MHGRKNIKIRRFVYRYQGLKLLYTWSQHTSPQCCYLYSSLQSAVDSRLESRLTPPIEIVFSLSFPLYKYLPVRIVLKIHIIIYGELHLVYKLANTLLMGWFLLLQGCESRSHTIKVADLKVGHLCRYNRNVK